MNSAFDKCGFRIICLLCFWLVSVSYGAAKSSDVRNKIIPVVNLHNQQESISRNGLSAIFKMRLRRWEDGSQITVFVLQDEDSWHKLFCKQILNVFPHQMRRGWNKLVFSGTGQAPVAVENKSEMIERIATTPGAVGYLPAGAILDGVKVLKIK